MFFVLFCNYRVIGQENIPATEGGLILANHLSFFDPVIVGIACKRRINYLARRTLFKNPLFGALISALDAIEIDRDRSGIAGLKETLVRIRRSELVLMFPEGTRSSDGTIKPIQTGFISVARRSKGVLVPVSIYGAFESFPRSKKLPARFPICVVIGKPISPEEVATMDETQLADEISHRLHSGLAQAREICQLRSTKK